MNGSIIYRCAQVLLAPGSERRIGKYARSIAEHLPSAGRLLDVGCGPFSRLWALGLHPVGLDLSAEYTASFRLKHEPVVNGSADNLPLLGKTFDGIWSFGLLHHLSDEAVHRVIGEAMRVRRPDGYIVIFDAVLPDSAWSRPLASIIRRIDRGHFMRRQEDIENILRSHGDWSCQRVDYAMTGLEGMFCTYPASMLGQRMPDILK